MASLPTTSFAVLGLLTRGAKSGYELAGLATRTISHFWPIAKSQVYGELARLERLGYVRGTAIRQQKMPDKRVFRLSAAGEAALDAWLAQPHRSRDRYRSEFLVKVFFGERIPAETLDEHFSRYHAGVVRYRDELAHIGTLTAGQPEVAFRRATALLGRGLTDAADAWVRRVRPQLTKRSRASRVRADSPVRPGSRSRSARKPSSGRPRRGGDSQTG